MELAIQKFAEVVDRNQRFLCVSHQSPDGDAVGSTLAMGLLLQALGKDVTFFNVDPVPYNFEFLPGAQSWETELQAKPEVTVVLDCAEPSRVGDQFPAAGWGDTVCVVDHHKTWDPAFADVYLRDVHAAATGELVFRLAEHFGVMTPEIAQNLYCCLLTDTGSFRYSNTSKTTFTIAGELVGAGVDPWFMTSHVYESQPRERVELLARVLETLEVSAGGRLAFLTVDEELVAEGHDAALYDGFINYARSIQGVQVATQLTFATEDTWRVSFRSRGLVDVSALAEQFGGGGHHNAAGCTIHGSESSVRESLASGLQTMLDGK